MGEMHIKIFVALEHTYLKIPTVCATHYCKKFFLIMKINKIVNRIKVSK